MTDEAAPAPLERILEQSPGTCILFAYADTVGALEAATDADEHPHALWHLRRAVDELEHAHRALKHNNGTRILADGEPEPVDTWPSRPAS